MIEEVRKRYSVVFAGEAQAALVRAASPQPCVCVRDRDEFIAETAKRGVVAFVDAELLAKIDREVSEVYREREHDGAYAELVYQVSREITSVPVVAIVDAPPAETLPRVVQLFTRYPWLSHVVSRTLLASSIARGHLTTLIDRLASDPAHGQIGSAGVGRVARLARASRREARFERIHEFFARQGLPPRAIAAFGEIAEELVMNALYDAPLEAGYFKAAVPRTEDVELPQEHACEISYGTDDGNAFVRVRDTFGALSRDRLLEVLRRCQTRNVDLDTSRGGAGLGLWRVFSSATTVSITVIPGRLTDILVGIATRDRKLGRQLQAVDLQFAPEANGSCDALRDDQHGELDRSITLVQVA